MDGREVAILIASSVSPPSVWYVEWRGNWCVGGKAGNLGLTATLMSFLVLSVSTTFFQNYIVLWHDQMLCKKFVFGGAHFGHAVRRFGQFRCGGMLKPKMAWWINLECVSCNFSLIRALCTSDHPSIIFRAMSVSGNSLGWSLFVYLPIISGKVLRVFRNKNRNNTCLTCKKMPKGIFQQIDIYSITGISGE